MFDVSPVAVLLEYVGSATADRKIWQVSDDGSLQYSQAEPVTVWVGTGRPILIAGNTNTLIVFDNEVHVITKISISFSAVPNRPITLRIGNQIVAYSANLTDKFLIYQPKSTMAGRVQPSTNVYLDAGAGATNITADTAVSYN